MQALIDAILTESLQVKRDAVTGQRETLIAAADMLVTAIASGHKLLLFGNGGSAADAQHLAAEFVNRFQIDRRPLPAMALTTDTSIITSIGNDESFTQVFARQVEALGRPDDVAWALSTSGESANILAALAAARRAGLHCLGMTGAGGRMRDHTDLLLEVESPQTARVQETHITMGHILCQLVEHKLFPHKAPVEREP
ncbi:MAG: D-sedoheptulose 7-phosphate isomerase [Desulfobacterales bacterium]|nr:D-sedoheptulose 7-phosphate isomerase [Desulfobacterales bacterium]MDJ0886759.1 D-sedoheptulose 7-phosphate isomerase [Desulfobacterales bacterium]MDJ0991554.1 D-sedoheptulose 7-phosphate isomerase [Desulfobacterales bacterium]